MTENKIENKTILVVDDERRIVDIISYNLKKEGFNVLHAYDGEEGLALALNEKPDLVILDIMMPKIDGFKVCKRIRKKLQIPIILLTAKAEENDKVIGLELGADDYVTKPFSNRELIARVRANIRRTNMPQYSQEDKIQTYGELTIDDDKLELRRRGEPIVLTNREFELIRFLATHNQNVFTREELLEKVWGYEYFGDARTVDVTIRRLRAKVEDNAEKPKYIMTKRSVGYYFENQDNQHMDSSQLTDNTQETDSNQ